MVYTKHFSIRSLKHLRQGKDYVEDAMKTIIDTKNNSSSHLDHLFPYILNDDKSCSKQLVSGHRLMDVYNAANEFILTKERHARRDGRLMEFDPVTKKMVLSMSSLEKGTGNRRAVLGHHLIQSFSPDDELTPEQIHDIGRQTVLEFTGGDYEFVIATHIDKAHIHNHIIINSTHADTGKAMRWKVVTKKNGKQFDVKKEEFEKVSDKIASKYGAKIIEKSPRNSYKKYTMWQTESIYKTKIKSRLDFLLEHSSSVDDFLLKADALNLDVDFNGKWTTYKLQDEPQIKVTRGRSLVKSDPEKYNLARIKETVELNAGAFTVEDVVSAFKEKETRQDVDFDYQVTIEPWQISHKTERGYYLNLDFGFNERMEVFVGAYKIDQLEDGNYHLYVKQSDYFYLMSNKTSEENKYITGRTLIKQMRLYNGQVPLKKEPIMTTLNELVEALNFLAENDITHGKQLSHLETKLTEAFQEANDTLNKLDDKIIDLQQLGKQLLGEHLSPDKEVIFKKIAEELPLADKDELSFETIEKEIASISLSRNLLKERLTILVKEIDHVHSIQANKHQSIEEKHQLKL